MLSLNKIEIDRDFGDVALIEGAWGGIFYYPRFVEPAAKALNLEGGAFILKSEETSICALNLLLQKRPMVRAATIPLLFQYFGPLFAGGFPDEGRMAIVDNYLSGSCDFAYFSLPPSLKVEPIFSRGWHPRRTMTLALDDDEISNWGRDFRDDVKNKIRKARREKICVEIADSLPEKLWMLAYRRRGVSVPLAPANLKQWCSELMAYSLLRLYIAKSGDIPVAFRGELLQGEFAYDWIAGSDPDYHATGANQLLMAEIGDDLKSMHIKTWDLVGGQIKSIADFKKSFGAREYYHYQAFKSFNIRGSIFGMARKLKNAWRH